MDHNTRRGRSSASASASASASPSTSASIDGEWTVWKLLFLVVWAAHLVAVAAAFRGDSAAAGGYPTTSDWNGMVATALVTGIFIPWMCTWGACLVARYASFFLNMPHKDYWLAPERRERTLARLARLSWPLGLLVVLAQADANLFVIAPALALETQTWFGGGVGGVLWFIAIVAWAIVFLLSFRLPARGAPADAAPGGGSGRDAPRSPHRRPGR
jgi:hypothetical protein